MFFCFHKENILEIFVYIIGGFLAGLATGLVGLSAATIVAPLFAIILKMDPYTAIGIALASDVFASAGSAYIYTKKKNIDILTALFYGSIIVIFTFFGSYFSSEIKPDLLGGSLNILVVFLGLRFIFYPIKDKLYTLKSNHVIIIKVFAVFASIFVGLTSGVLGAGGGLSILALLTMVLGFNLKKAVGTSVLIMTFVALIGAITHFFIKPPDFLTVFITSIFAFVGANIASIFANRVSEKLLNRIIGIFLLCFGVILFIISFY